MTQEGQFWKGSSGRVDQKGQFRRSSSEKNRQGREDREKLFRKSGPERRAYEKAESGCDWDWIYRGSAY